MTRGLSDAMAVEFKVASTLLNAYIEQAVRFRYTRALTRNIIRFIDRCI